MTSHLRRRLWSLAGVVALLASAPAVAAQCPDGSKPPCGVRQQARANPPLDAAKWIVVPFGNVTRAADLDWLRDASVNLLTLELGRWSDVRAVSDKAVADLLAALPAKTRESSLSLNAGLDLARRSGAGMLVMGDFFKLGAGARITANVFDVRTGRRVRTAEQRVASADSLLNAFGPLSRGVLDLPAPADARSGDVGTASVLAFQSYLAGMRDFNRFHLEDATRHFMRALELDSTFALANLQVAVIRMWGEPSVGEASMVRRYALAAQRLGATLPMRERAMTAWAVQSAAAEYGRACESIVPVVARDSSDVLALFMLGDCAYHDRTIVKPAHDSQPARYRWGPNVSLSALRRALLLDPTFNAAFPHILDILRTPNWNACAPRQQPSEPCDLYRAVVFRDGDTLLVQPMSSARNDSAYWAQVDRSARERPMVANHALAQRIAEDWLATDPANAQAAAHLAQVQLLRGDLEGADARMRGVSTTAFSGNLSAIRLRMELALKLGKADEARAWFDSLVKAVPDQPSVMILRGGMELAFGRTGRLTQGLLAQPFVRGAGAAGEAYARAVPRLIMGLPVENIGALESAYWNAMDTVACALECRHNRIWYSQHFASTAPRPSLPDYGTKEQRAGFDGAMAVAIRDTALLRRRAFVHDSSARGNVAMLWSDFGWSLIAAELYLALGDTAGTLKMLRFATDTAMITSPHAQAFRAGIWNMGTWPRMMLRRAELAAATGSTDEARKWYDRVLDLWAKADPELQPDIARIRAARAALGERAVP